MWLGRFIGLWEEPPVVSASSWFLISGVGLLLNIDKALEGESVFKRSVKVVSPAAIVTAILSVSVLPLLVEILVLPVVTFLTMMITYIQLKESEDRIYNINIVAVPLGIYALLSLTIALYRFFDELSVGQSIAESLLLPMWLTLPTLMYVRFLVTWEQTAFLLGAAKKRVYASDYGDRWPLNVESALLCARDNAVWIVVNGKRYALNGGAPRVSARWGIDFVDKGKIQRVDYKFMEPYGEMLKDGEANPVMVRVDPLIQDGLALSRPEGQ